MKLFFSHMLFLLLGVCFSAVFFLHLSKISSLPWQNDLKVTATYLLQSQGALAAQENDWAHVQFAFEEAEELQSRLQPKEWGLARPIYAWSTASLVSYANGSFSMVNTSVVAYSLEEQGKASAAESAYQNLIKEYPSRDKAYFRAVAQQSLAAFGTKIPPVSHRAEK